MSSIIFLHGFASSSNSFKGRLLREQFPDRAITPNLLSKPFEDIKTIDEIILKNPDSILVGSSLGGFYTNYFSRKYNLRSLYINPLIDVRQIEVFIGVNRYYHSGEEFNFTRDDFNYLIELKKLLDLLPIPRYKRVVLAAKDDNVIDYKIAKKYFKHRDDLVKVFNYGGHGFNCKPEIIEALSNFVS